MSGETDDPDVYHQDFTTASAWEVFIDEVEKVIVKWKENQVKIRQPIKEGDLKGEWYSRTEVIVFGDEKLNLSWWSLREESPVMEEPENPSSTIPQALSDMMSTAGDFATASGCPRIAFFYGIREFLLVSFHERPSMFNETKIKVLLSSLTIAIRSTRCELPAFVQLLEEWQNFYLGSLVGTEISADYEMVHLQRPPQHCKHLTGLLDIFKSKINQAQQLPSINIAVRMTYSFDMVGPPWMGPWQYIIIKRICKDESSLLSYWSDSDLIGKLYLYATWPQLTDQMVVDSQSYSDLEPMHSHSWSVQIEMNRKNRTPVLTKMLSSLCSLSMNDPKLPDWDKVQRQTSSSLKKYLDCLFPDPKLHPHDCYDEAPQKACEETLHTMKAAPCRSLAWRLAFILSEVHYVDSSKTARLWYEFTERLHYHWDKAIPVPGVQPGFPDRKTCLLHQKLQMLNVCIEKKSARSKELAVYSASSRGPPHAAALRPSSDSEEGDEDSPFYDCDSDAGDVMEDAKDELPAGRREKHPTLRLLRTGEPLYIPFTQDLIPETEDEVCDADDMSQAMAHSRTVTSSDMQSFKAANPGCVMEDFVRWYSPRDWCEDGSGALDRWGQPRGELSARMKLPDNTWLELWSAAAPVPVARQRRLFDEGRTAEGVLAWLRGLSPPRAALALLPVLAHAAADHVLRGLRDDGLLRRLPGLPDAAERLARRAAAATRESPQRPAAYEKLLDELDHVETKIYTAELLRLRFFPGVVDTFEEEDITFFSTLLDEVEVTVPGGPRGRVGTSIRDMVINATKRLQMVAAAPDETQPKESAPSQWPSSYPPDAKEVIMRVTTPRPGPASKSCPQRMYAMYRKEELRLAGCFTRDVAFF